jgi:hypothetical protein
LRFRPFLVRIKYKQRLSSRKWKSGGKRERHGLHKLKEEEGREKYGLEIKKKGLEKDPTQNIQKKGKTSKRVIKGAAN